MNRDQWSPKEDHMNGTRPTATQQQLLKESERLRATAAWAASCGVLSLPSVVLDSWAFLLGRVHPPPPSTSLPLSCDADPTASTPPPHF